MPRRFAYSVPPEPPPPLPEALVRVGIVVPAGS